MQERKNQVGLEHLEACRALVVLIASEVKSIETMR